MPGGRPRLPGTDEERAERRREQILKNVHQFRERKRNALAQKNTSSSLPALRQRAALPQYGEFSLSTASGWNHSVSAKEYRPDLLGSTDATENRGAYLLWLSTRLPYQLHFGPTYRDAFISKYLYSCSIGDDATQSSDVRGYLPVNLCCGSWLSSTYNSASPDVTEKRLLSDLLLASALKEFGASSDNTAIKTYALDAHNKVTQALVQHVVNYQTGKYSTTDPHLLSSCIMAFAMAELVVHQSWQRFLVHLRGAGAVMQAAGPEKLTTPSARRHWHGYRNLELAFSLMHRQRTFPCDQIWFGLPNLEPYSALEPYLSNLVDIAYLIPPELESLNNTNADSYDSVQDQIFRIRNIRKRLLEWRLSLCLQDPWTLESTDSQGVIQYRVHFPNDPTANLLVSYCGTSLILNDLGADVATRLSGFDPVAAALFEKECLSEARQWIQKAIDTLKLFLSTLPTAIGKLNCLSSLDAAWAISVKRGYAAHVATCEELALKFESRGLPILRRH